MLVALENALFFPILGISLLVLVFVLVKLYREYLQRIDRVLETVKYRKVIEEDYKKIKDEFEENYSRIKRENKF